MMKVLAIVQARTGSSRLPNKVMKIVEGRPIIEILFLRLTKAKNINQIILATSDLKRDDNLAHHIKNIGFKVFRGSEENVLERFFHASEKYKADIIIRITGDCPLIDASIIDEMILSFKASNLDYLSNIDPPTFPDGLDVEIFTKSSFNKVFKLSKSSFDKEHVTPFYRSSKIFKTDCFKHYKNLSDMRFTLDEALDFIFVKNVFKHFKPDIFFSWKKVVTVMNSKTSIIKSNQDIPRNEGSKKNE
jgi:glutamate-1-semialdehyde 2,1-aminomutase|tara:strand:- start:2480 stop:3217 length:738 start_codon:yes stop_codon:yes gene_type:complete